MDKQKLTIIILWVLIVLAVGYIAFDKYGDSAYMRGAQFGYEQAIIQIIQEASTCQTVPLFVENTTINLVAVECLQFEEQNSTES